MVRRLEPEVRRRHLAEAVLAITARDGLDAVTVREVAKEAGVSAGMVQHHFRSRDDMLLFTCEYMIERSGRHFSGRIALLPKPRDIRTILRTIFVEMLPLDEERRTGIRVWMAFLARAVVRDDLEAFMRNTHINTHRMITGLLRDAQLAGTISPDLDPDRTAISLFALVDGLVSHVLLEHYSWEQALVAIDDALHRIFCP